MRNRLVRMAGGHGLRVRGGLQFVRVFLAFLASSQLLYSQTGQPSTNRPLRPLTPSGISSTGAVIRARKMVGVAPRLRSVGTLTVISRDASGTRVTTNVISSATSAIEVDDSTPAQHIVLPATAAQLSTIARGRNVFPGSLVLTTPGQAARQAELFLEPSPVPLAWSAVSRVYSSQLVVGLVTTNQQTSITLSPPIVVRFFPSNAVVNPGTLTISKTGVEGFQSADIYCRPSQRHPNVTVQSDLGELLKSIPVEGGDFTGLFLDIFPIPFLFATLLGGVVGGVARCLHRPLKSGKATVRRTCEGAVVALIITGAVAAGIHIGELSQTIINQPIGVFVVAAIAGYGGTTVLDRLSDRVLDLGGRAGAKNTANHGAPVTK